MYMSLATSKALMKNSQLTDMLPLVLSNEIYHYLVPKVWRYTYNLSMT